LVLAFTSLPASATTTKPASSTTKHKTRHVATTTKGKHPSTAGKSVHASAHSKGRKGKATAKKSRGQQAIDSERARQIQTALIREHYLNGEPSGSWDQTTHDALVKFQGDHGWQTKVVPDSRALIKLGLGPDHSQTLNPEVLNRPDAARDQVPGGAGSVPDRQ
jgi:hypothetical protein